MTPAVEHGLLAGTLREGLLRARLLEEADLNKDDIRNAPVLAAINSVRGALALQRHAHDSWSLERIPEGSGFDPALRRLVEHVRQVMPAGTDERP